MLSLVLFILFRVVNSLLINTFFQADEYWQALEPAHRFVFGYGYLTWEWEIGLRSYLHPLLYIVPYQLIKWANLNGKTEYDYVIILPKIVNGIIAGVGDYYLYHYVQTKFCTDLRLAKIVTILSLLSSWNWYCWPRSFANSIELTLTIVSLYFFQTRKYVRTLLIAAFTCLVRPTNAIIWIFTLPELFMNRPIYVVISAFVAISAVTVDALINYLIFGKFNIPLLSFFRFNVTDNLSSFYGVSRLDFYLFQAIPILLLNYLPFFIYGIISTKFSHLKGLLLFYISIFSLIPHKEFRFIYPMMPILLIYTGVGVSRLYHKLSKRISHCLILINIAISLLLGIYFTRYHESGEYLLPSILRDHVLSEESQDAIDIGFLTPCHSTPFQSHFHLPAATANIWFITCEPPLGEHELSAYMDESDHFYENPERFLWDNFPNLITGYAPNAAKFPHEWPTYLVVFEHLWENEELRNYIQTRYFIVEKVWNSPFHWDHRRTGDLLILKYEPQTQESKLS